MFIYKKIIKPLLFWLSIERAKQVVILSLRIIGRLPFGHSLLRHNYRVDDPSLEREVFGIRFKNPIGLAAGFDTNGEITNELDAIGFGFIEIGTITPEQQSGNPQPRVYRLPKDRAIINRMGYPNRGWAYVINHIKRRKGSVIIGCNIAPNSRTQHSDIARDYQKSFRNLYQYVDYFTVSINFSTLICDDTKTAQMAITELLNPLFDFRRGQSEYRPIMVKITSDLSDEMIDSVTDTMIDTPLDGVVAANGTSNRDNLQTSYANISRIGAGRLSGEPIKERVVEIIKRIHERSGGAYPIIGVGGVANGDDAKRLLDAGASLVQIYTSFIYDGPTVVGDICRDLISIVDEEVVAESVDVKIS